MSNEYQLRNPNGSVIRIFPGAAKDGDVVQIDADLEPFINRTEK